MEREIESDKKERGEIDAISRSNKGQEKKNKEENTEQANTRKDKGHIPGD